MKTVLSLNLYSFVVTMSLFAQDISAPSKIAGLGVNPSPSHYYLLPLTLSDTNQTLDSLAARNILWKPFNGTTIAVQAVCGVGLAAASFALLPGSHSEGLGAGIAIVLASMLGAASLPTSVYYSGNLMGGNGELWPTLGGCLVGGGLATLPNIISGTGQVGPTAVRVGIAALAGAIAGYHLSASPIYETDGTSPSALKRELTSDDTLSIFKRLRFNLSPQEGYGIVLGFHGTSRRNIYEFGIAKTSRLNGHEDSFLEKYISLEVNAMGYHRIYGFVGGANMKGFGDFGLAMNFMTDFYNDQAVLIRPQFGFSVIPGGNLHLTFEYDLLIWGPNISIRNYWMFGLRYNLGVS